MSQNDQAPQTRPMETLALKSVSHFVHKNLGQQIAPNCFIESLLHKRRQRPAHPLFHRQNKPGLRTIVNGRWQQIAARFDEETFDAGITLLHRDRKSEPGGARTPAG